MVKFADVTPGSVVQLGRFNKDRSPLSHSVGMVVSKEITKIGNSTWTAIGVQVGPRQVEMVSLHNIRELLA
jgi:hypothetical protein